MKLRFFYRCFLIALLPFVFTACGTNLGSAIDTARFLFTPSQELVVNKNPQYRYLNVQLQDIPAIFVLGYIDPTPQGPVEVWYGRGVTLNLLNGRLISFVGEGDFIKQWPRVTMNYPYDLATIEREQIYTRTRDEMPGYRFNIKEEVLVKPLPQAPKKVPAHLKTSDVFWFQEEAMSMDGSRSTLHSHYAIKKSAQGSEWVYGQQCLAPGYCLTWYKSADELKR